MTKKKTMKNIKTPNKFEDGGYWKDVANNASLYGIGSGVGSLIGGNYDAGDNVSNILSTAGAAAAFIPGPWGAVASTALSAAGGLYNRAFGTDWNEAGLAKAENNINTLKNFNSGATTYDALIADINNINQLNTKVKASDLGKNGWFSSKTEDKANSLNKTNAAAYNTAMRNINVTADNIAADTLANLERNYAAFGGLLNRTHGADFTNGLMFINSGGTHESNPYEGVPVSMDQEGNPNLVEEGEVIWNDYVFSNRLKVPKSIQKKYKLGKREMTFANAVDKLSKESEERPNDPISIRGLESILTNMAIEQETIKSKKNVNNKSNKFPTGGRLRYAPVVGSALGVIGDLFSKPDYSNANLVMEAANKAGEYLPVSHTPIGDYLTYTPFDINYHANKLAGQAGATRRAIINQSAGNRATAMAGLLAADYNAQTKYGDLVREAEEFNLEQRQAVKQFNRATNQANAEMSLQAAKANQAARQASANARLEGITQAAALRDAEDKQRAASISANLSGLFTNLGNVGIDILNRADRDMLINSGAFGTLSQKPADWPDKKWKAYQDVLAIKAYGGKIYRKRSRKGLTY